MVHGTFALVSLGVKNLLRCRAPLGAVILRALFITVRSWELSSYQLVTSQFAPREPLCHWLPVVLRGVAPPKNHRPSMNTEIAGGFLLYPSLLSALVLRACYVAARPWEL